MSLLRLGGVFLDGFLGMTSLRFSAVNKVIEEARKSVRRARLGNKNIQNSERRKEQADWVYLYR